MSRLLSNTPGRLKQGATLETRSSRWSVLWSFMLTLGFLLTVSFTATPLGITRASTEDYDARQMVASLRMEAEELFQGIETHGLGWFFTKPVDRLAAEVSPEYIRGVVQPIADGQRISPELVLSLIQTLSNFDTLKVSKNGAMGLMQLHKDEILGADVESPFSPRQNITTGVKKLRTLLDKRNGNWELALSDYFGAVFKARPGSTDHKADDKEISLLVNKTLELYRAEITKRYPALS